MSTLSDNYFRSLNEVIVDPPAGVSPSVTEAQAESTALNTARKHYSQDNPVISEAKLVYVIGYDSPSTHGTLFWIINLTQPGGDWPIAANCPFGNGACRNDLPSRDAFLVGYVNATTGATTVILNP